MRLRRAVPVVDVRVADLGGIVPGAVRVLLREEVLAERERESE